MGVDVMLGGDLRVLIAAMGAAVAAFSYVQPHNFVEKYGVISGVLIAAAALFVPPRLFFSAWGIIFLLAGLLVIGVLLPLQAVVEK